MEFVTNWIKNNDYKIINGFNEMEMELQLQCERTKCEEIILKQQMEITKHEELKLKRAECELEILKYQKK